MTDVTPDRDPAADGRTPGRASSPSRRWGRRAAWTLTVVLVVWGAAVAVTAYGARGDLRIGADRVLAARQALGTGDLQGALGALDAAERRLGRARVALSRPHVRVAAQLPAVGANLTAARAVAEASGEIVAAALPVLEGAVELGDEERDGGLPVAALDAIAPEVRAAAEAVADAHERVATSPERWLVAEVADARQRFLDLTGPLVAETALAADLAAALPTFLGADGPRTYLLLAANPAELRGQTGYLGSYALATFDRGQLDVGTFGSLSDLPDADRDAVDVGVLPERWLQFGGPWRWRATHATPDVPSAASAIEQLWATTAGPPVDGTVVVDPFAVASLLEATGPVTTDDGVELTPGTAVEFLTHEAYAEFDDADQRKELLGEAATLVLQRFLASTGDLLGQLDELTGIVANGHLLVHAADPGIQAVFAAAGVDGALPDPRGDFLTVVANSASNSKVDYYHERELDHRVELEADGVARGDLTVRLHNRAPTSGQPRYVIGPNVPGLEAGESQLFVSTYCATSCELLAAEGGEDGRLERSEELGHPVAAGWVRMRSGASHELRYRWRTEDAWWSEEGRLHYRLTVRHQTTVRRPSLRVTVSVPDGFRVEAAPDGATVDDGAVRWAGRERGTVTLELVLRPVTPGEDTPG